MNSFHAGGLFQRAGARSQGACTSARLSRAHARTTASYPNEGNSALWLDEGYTVEIVYLDFAKAFDSVNHRLLLT